MELEVAPSNRVSRVEDEQIEPTRVERVVFSPFVSSKTAEQGEWMVTFDSRNLSDFEGEVEVSRSRVSSFGAGTRSTGATC